MKYFFIIIIVIFSFSACSGDKVIKVTVPAQGNTELEIQNTADIIEKDNGDEMQADIIEEEESIEEETGEDIEEDVSDEGEKETKEVIRKEDEAVRDEDVSVETVTVTIPAKVLHDPIFVPQAPHANWELPYQEACEEASLIIAAKYFYNESLDKDIMDKEIFDVVAWQKDTFGYYEHTTVDEMITMAEDYFKLKVRRADNPTVDILKNELAQGYLVIAPMAGRELGNPNFRQPGPVYHALVLIGYDSKYFITHDPGTRNGENYKYTFKVFMNALHDWHDEDITKGDKAVIVVEGKSE